MGVVTFIRPLIVETRPRPYKKIQQSPPIAELTIEGLLTLAHVIAGRHQQCLDQAAKTLTLADADRNRCL